MTLPPIVTEAYARAERAGFPLSCEPEVGAFLAVLAAAVREEGRILELGTGVGVGTAWVVHGLDGRTDVEVITVDLDEMVQRTARQGTWPPCVRFLAGDGAALVSTLGRFDLIFADAPGGKLTGLDRAIAALAPCGLLLVDDMDLARQDDPALRTALAAVRAALLANPALTVVELECGSGMMLGVAPFAPWPER